MRRPPPYHRRRRLAQPHRRPAPPVVAGDGTTAYQAVVVNGQNPVQRNFNDPGTVPITLVQTGDLDEKGGKGPAAPVPTMPFAGRVPAPAPAAVRVPAPARAAAIQRNDAACGPGMEVCGTAPQGEQPACCPTETPSGGRGTPAGVTPYMTVDDVVGSVARAPAPRPAGAPVTIDVRTLREFRTGHIPGALTIPVDDLERRIEEVAEATQGDWNAPVRVYCAKGIRSKRAVDYLRGLGFKNVTDLGGLETSLRTVRRPQVLTGGSG